MEVILVGGSFHKITAYSRNLFITEILSGPVGFHHSQVLLYILSILPGNLRYIYNTFSGNDNEKRLDVHIMMRAC